MAEEKVVYTPCQGWGCHEYCLLETHVKDGEITRCQKVTLPGCQGTPMQICKKGIAARKLPYDEKRFLHPMKRVGERGEGKFEQISWDQAFDEIGAKINEVVEKYGKRAVVMNVFYCGIPGSRMSTTDRMCNRFLNVFGMSKLEYTSVDYASVHQDVADTGMPYTANRYLIQGVEDYLLVWGGNPVGFTRPARMTRMILDAQERGAKFVHVSNMFDNTSAKADQWVNVRTGTDASLALGMAHVIVRDGLVDEDFMLDETVAALLVNTDTGKFIRANEITDDEQFAGWFCVVDSASGQVAFTPSQGTERHQGYANGMKPLMQAEGVINGLPYKTAYQLLVEHLEGYSPELQEKVTGVPAAVCEQMAHEYAEAESAVIAFGNGLRYQNGTQALRALKLISYLTGKYGKAKNGVVTTGIDSLHMNTLDHNVVYLDPRVPVDNAAHVNFRTLLEAPDNPDAQQYKVFLNAEGNPLLNWPNKKLWTERIFPNMELIVTFEIRYTDTCRWSDYILPEASMFERTELIADADNTFVLCEAAIEPRGEARTPVDIWSGLAKRVGLEQYFDKTHDEWFAYAIEHNSTPLLAYPDVTDQNATGEEEAVPLTLEMLKEKTLVHQATPDGQYIDIYAISPFFTPTGRVEFYSEDYSEIGMALPVQENCIVIDPEEHKKHPLHFFIGRHKYFMQGQFTNSPEMMDLAKTNFGAALNPKTALEYGLRDGDEIEVFNDRGVMKATLQLREDIPPSMCHTWYSFDETFYYPYGNKTPQDLATPQNDPETGTPWSRVSGKKWFEFQTMMGVPNPAMFIAGDETPEVIFDVTCDVRKAE